MQTRTFKAESTKEALRMVREALGGDAVILNNKRVDGMVEIVAACGTDILAPSSDDLALKGIEYEFKTLKYLLQEQLSGLVWENSKRKSPVTSMIMAKLLSSGYELELAKDIARDIDPDLALDATEELLITNIEKMVYIKKMLLSQISGIFLFLGPCGVGKTSTLIKLATQYGIRYGFNAVAIIALEEEYVSGNSRLINAAKILKIDLQEVNNNTELQQAVKNFSDKKIIFIDTPGLNLNNNKFISKYDFRDFRKIMHLSCNLQYVFMDRFLHNFKTEIYGAILTKVDAGINLGEILSICIKYKLPINFITDGVNIPDDIKSPDVLNMVRQSLQFTLKSQETVEDLIVHKLSRKISEEI